MDNTQNKNTNDNFTSNKEEIVLLYFDTINSSYQVTYKKQKICPSNLLNIPQTTPDLFYPIENYHVTLNQTTSKAYIITEKDLSFYSTFYTSNELNFLLCEQITLDINEEKRKLIINSIMTLKKIFTKPPEMQKIYFLFLYKFPIEEIFTDSSFFFAQNINYFYSIYKFIQSLSISYEIIERLILEIIVNQNEIFIKEIQKLIEPDQNINNDINNSNFIVELNVKDANKKIINEILKVLSCTVSNEHFDFCSNRTYIYMKDEEKQLDSINKAFNKLLFYISRNQIFINKNSINENKDEQNKDNFIFNIQDMQRLYLFYFKSNQDFFTQMIKNNEYNCLNKDYHSYKKLLFLFSKFLNINIIDKNENNLPSSNLIKNDDIYALSYFYNISTDLLHPQLHYLYTIIPLFEILKIKLTNPFPQSIEIVKKYFYIIQNIKKLNSIYFIDEGDDLPGVNISYFLNQNCTKLYSINDIYKKLKLNCSENNNNFVADIKFINCISYLFPYYRIILNESNAYLFRVIVLNQINNEYKIQIDFKNTNFFEYLVSLIKSNYTNCLNCEYKIFEKNVNKNEIKDKVEKEINNYLENLIMECIVEEMSIKNFNNDEGQIYNKETNYVDVNSVIYKKLIRNKICKFIINNYNGMKL